MLTRLSIRMKLIVSFAIVIAISAIASLFALNASSVVRQASGWNDHTYKVLLVVNNISAAMVDQETGLRGFLISGDKAFLAPYDAGKSAFETELAKVKALTSDNASQQDRLNEVEAISTEWHSTVADVEFKLASDPATLDQARKLEASGAGKKTMDAMRVKLDEISDAESKLLAERSARLQENFTLTNLSLILGGVGATLGAVVMCWLLTRAIGKPISSVTETMLQLSSGNNNVDIAELGRKDEIGAMAGAVEVFRQNALEKIEADRLIEFTRTQSEKDRIAQEHADRERADAMAKATNDLGSGLKRLSTGDLSFQLQDAFAPDFEGLRHDFNTSVTQLANTLASVADSVGSITNGSKEISTGTNDLSKRTEQQAAALEETAAALDEITANVTSSSKRAEEARDVAAKANQSATKSGEVVAQAVDAMSRIESSSNQISNIIGVIDEIAFQTNLLALNAGVEAARAGDAGKGFAVVAQEVRELAQRSAGAAKEIKSLIQTSSTEVSTGVTLVSATGEALKSIGELIVNINGHMEAIATSSREQSTGLAEVNNAVNQMDQTTQQNAAMVEQSSAAATTLANEANNLRDLVHQFDLGRSGHLSQALRKTALRMVDGDSQKVLSEPTTVARRVSGNKPTPTQVWSEF